MNTYSLPDSLYSYRAQFSENKKKFHKIYAVTISFQTPYYRVSTAVDLIDEWIKHHKAAFNEVWLQPELCPSSRRVHFHGLIDVKDQFRLNKMLRLFKGVGSFHIETIKSSIPEYIDYCTKETGITEVCEYQLDTITARRAPKEEQL